MNREDRRTLLCSLLAAVTVRPARGRMWRNSFMENVAHSSQPPSEKTAQPTIARIWRGRVRRERANEYQKYNYEFGIKPLREKALGVQALREDRERETEFVTISYWENIEAMSRFTGGDPRKVHHLPRDPEFLVEMPQSVQILHLYESHGQTGWLRDRQGNH